MENAAINRGDFWSHLCSLYNDPAHGSRYHLDVFHAHGQSYIRPRGGGKTPGLCHRVLDIDLLIIGGVRGPLSRLWRQLHPPCKCELQVTR